VGQQQDVQRLLRRGGDVYPGRVRIIRSMSRRSVEGTCHISGVHGKLSFEHVPPKKAFNNKRVVKVGFDEAMSAAYLDLLDLLGGDPG